MSTLTTQVKPQDTAVNDAVSPTIAAANEEDLLQLLLAQLQEPVLQLDLSGSVIFANNAAISLLSEVAENLVSKQLHSLLPSPWCNIYSDLFAQHRCEQALTHSAREVLVKRGDSLLPVNLSLSYMPAKQPCVLACMQDLSRQKAEIEKLHLLASTDPLTGLANRRCFSDTLHSLWQQCTASHYPISIVVVDVDHFKQFNDKYGHIQGDRCLQRIANELQVALPNEDCLAARYGGEEFALILPGLNSTQAKAVAEQLRCRINELLFTELGPRASISISQGIAAEVNGQFRTPEALLFAADTALYRAKQDGRDRVNLSY